MAPGTTNIRLDFAKQVLGALSGGTLFLAALQAIRWYLYGASHRDEYFFLTLLLLLASIVAYILLEWSLATGLHFYAWFGGFLVALMTLIDPEQTRIEVPFLLCLPVVGMFVMRFCSVPGAWLFATAYAAFVGFLGVFFDQFDSAVSLGFFIFLMWVVSKMAARLLDRLVYLEGEQGNLIRWRDSLKACSEENIGHGRTPARG